MKTIQTMSLAITLFVLLASCQSTSGQIKDLSNKETRSKIMGEIANDSTMSKEMLGAMMNSPNGMMMLQHNQMMMGNQNSMMNMMKNNPAMMQSMFSSIMNTAQGDTSMMHRMIQMMKGNPQMMQMMQNMMGNRKTNGMHHMGKMNN